VKGVFVELPAFERYRSSYLDDDSFMALQNVLMKRPEAGGIADARRARENAGTAGHLLMVVHRPTVLALHPLRQGRDG
jgi:hypothetical protein